MARIKRADLNALATEMNDTLGMDPAIDFAKKVKDTDLKAVLIREASHEEDGVLPEDKLSEESWATLVTLGVPVAVARAEGTPEPEADPEPEAEEDPKPAAEKKTAAKKTAAKPAAEKKPATKKADAKPRYTRATAFADAAKSGKIKDLDKLAEKANELYIDSGGKDNIKEAKWMQTHAVAVLTALGFATVADGKITIVD